MQKDIYHKHAFCFSQSFFRYLVVCLFACFLCINANAQTLSRADSFDLQYKLAVKVANEAYYLKNTSPLDSLLLRDVVTFNYIKAWLMQEKARQLTHNNGLCEEDIPKDSLETPDTVKLKEVINEILDCHQFAIDSTTGLAYLEAKYKRYDFIYTMINHHEDKMTDTLWAVYWLDLAELKPKGLRQEREGVGLSLGMAVSNGDAAKPWLQWIETGFSCYSLELPAIRFSQVKNGKKRSFSPKGYEIPKYANALSFRYAHPFTQNIHDVSLSLIEITSPVVIVPAKVGVQYIPDNSPRYYYRPALGFGWGAFSIAYAYNVPLLKGKDVFSGRHMINLSANFPLIEYKKIKQPSKAQ